MKRKEKPEAREKGDKKGKEIEQRSTAVRMDLAELLTPLLLRQCRGLMHENS